jgi:hypothetical protein
VRVLLAGPGRYERSHGRTTAIPSGTHLRSLVIRDHVAYFVSPENGRAVTVDTVPLTVNR